MTEIPLEGSKDITMAAECKLWTEIERMSFLVGTLQEQGTIMSKQLDTFGFEMSNSANDTKLMQRSSAAVEKEIILELGGKEEEEGKDQREKTNQKPTTSGNKGNKENDKWTTNQQKKRNVKEEVPGITIMDYIRVNKYDWDFFTRLEYERLSGPERKLKLADLEVGKQEELVTELPQEERANKMDYQPNWWTETNWGLRASDVRNPG